MQNTPTHQGKPGLLASLRALNPSRPVTLADALRIAELQADRLLQLTNALGVPVPTTIITNQPRIIVEHDASLPAHAVSGCSDWDSHRRTWVISLNPSEPRRRQRFTVLHEYKHILDHSGPGILEGGQHSAYQRSPEETLADYFAGCVLIPKRLLTAAYYDGIQKSTDLAQLFDVSIQAVQVRLAQVGLGELATDPRARSQRFERRYYRRAWLQSPQEAHA